MKQIMKRIGLAFCLAACLLSLAACGRASAAGGEGMTVDADAKEELHSIVKDFLTNFNDSTDEELDTWREQLQLALEEQAMAQSQMQLNKSVIESLDAWKAMLGDTGKMVKLDEMESWGFSRGDDGSYVVEAGATFEKRHVRINVSLNERMSTFLGAFQFNPEYTVEENMESAGMNTLMGMGTVFTVLIFISLLIACFVLINKAEANMKRKKEAVRAGGIPAVTVPEAALPEADLTDDLELVAVITAAIAASENTSSDGLVVRSIRRVPGSRWKRA